MPTSSDRPPTAYELALKHEIEYWPYACPVCGDKRRYGRRLAADPTTWGHARYHCANCVSIFSRDRGRMRHAIARFR
ncbi:hypothetical protein LCGC14_1186720 [marine sediment metagenome]|uniref:Uncharacterized protein n=1 Tax=marine sediment metagenome TaxID=412755 RepID=A0A0F9LKK0_9ZZZZ